MKINNEVKIGIMVCVTVGLLAVLTIKTGNFNFSKNGYQLKVLFKNIDGVNLNSPVMINGYEVGVVEEIHINTHAGQTLMELTLWISSDFSLKSDTKAYVKNLGFMGEKYVGLISGQSSGDLIKPGEVLIGEEPTNMEALFSNGEDIAKNLRNITSNIDDRLEVNKKTVDEILVNMNKTLKSVSSVVENADQRLKVNEQHIDSIVKNLHLLSVNLEEMSEDLKMNPWKLMYRAKEKKTDIGISE